MKIFAALIGALLLNSCSHAIPIRQTSIPESHRDSRGLAAIKEVKEVVEGGNHGGGGSGFEVAFKAIANGLATELEGYPENYFPKFSLSTFKKVVEESIVDASFDLLYREINKRKKRVDALNYPAQLKIILSIPGWKKLNDRQREDLVLHEYISLMGLEKDSYEISQLLMATIKPNRKKSPGELICKPEEMGLHDGDLCLWDLIEIAEADLDRTYENVEKAINKIKVPAGDAGDYANAIKEKALPRVKAARAIFPDWKEKSCSIRTAAMMGNQGAYYYSICELDSIQAQRKLILGLLSDLRETDL